MARSRPACCRLAPMCASPPGARSGDESRESRNRLRLACSKQREKETIMFALRGFTIVAALAVASVMAGCASDVKLDDSNKPPVENRNISPDANSARGAGAAQSNVANVDLG